jgi:lipopolysaccharide export system protein LptA
MKKYFLFLFILTITLLFSKTTQISITSDSFEANENKHQTIFNGNVSISKLSDTINSQKAVVRFDKNNKPIEYKVFKDVSFSISLKDSVLTGSCDELIYVPKSKVYKLNGHVNIVQSPTNRKIQATKVIIDTKINKINIIGQKNKPVKFIFEVEDK